MIYEKKQELYVMMFTMQSLHYKGILIKDNSKVWEIFWDGIGNQETESQ